MLELWDFTYPKPSGAENTKHVHLVSIISSRQGVDYIFQNIKAENVTLWLGAVDEGMTPHSYIVPGLGDAGDLAYGEKIDSKITQTE